MCDSTLMRLILQTKYDIFKFFPYGRTGRITPETLVAQTFPSFYTIHAFHEQQLLCQASLF
jgi:hypothetical protein